MSEQIEQKDELETIQEVEVVVETEPEQEKETDIIETTEESIVVAGGTVHMIIDGDNVTDKAVAEMRKIFPDMRIEADFPDETKEHYEEKSPVPVVVIEDETVSGPTTFAAWDAKNEADEKASDMQFLTHQFQVLVGNVMQSPDVEDKGAAVEVLSRELSQRLNMVKERKSKWQPLTDKAANFIADHIVKAEMKTEGGVKYPASDFAYVPDADKPSTWKLRMSEGNPGNITKAQLGRAAAAFSPGGFRGQRVQIPDGDIAKVKAKIRAEYSKLGVEPADLPPAIKERSFMVFKSQDTYRWATLFSNAYRDRDNPKEILSKAAHQDFVRAVDAGEWPMPELAWWHVKGKPLGKADLVFWDKANSCAWAAGDFASKEIAEAFANCQEPLGVSHGMPRSEIRRDEKDSTVITRYRSAEISFLPAKVAANLLTGAYSEEKSMNDEQKLEELRRVTGIDPEAIGAEKKAEAEALGLDSKEVKEEVVEPVTVETEQPAAAVLTPEQIGQAMAQAIQPVLDRLSALEQKAQAEPVEEKEVDNPFDAMMNSFKSSVIGSEETRVDGRTKEAKDAPVERPSGFQAKQVKVNSDSLVANTLNRLYSGQTAKELTGRQH